MPGEDNAGLVAKFYETLWNGMDLASIDQFTIGEEYVVHILRGELLGREALKEVAKYYFEYFPLIHVNIESQISQDLQVVTRTSWDITLNLTDQSSGQEITRKITRIAGVSIDRIDNGRIAESWNMFDTLITFFNIGEVTRRPNFVQILPGVTTCNPNQRQPCPLGQKCVQNHCVPDEV